MIASVDDVAELAVAASLVLVAVWVLALGRTKANVAFALFLFIRGVDWGASDLLEMAGHDAWADFADALMNGPAAAALLYFVSVFPYPRGAGRWRPDWLPFAALALIMMAWTAAELDAWLDPAGAPTSVVANSLMHVVFAVVAVLLARDFLRSGRDPVLRTDHLLLALGLATYEIGIGALTLRRAVRSGERIVFEVGGLAAAQLVVSLLAVVALIALGGILARAAGGSASDALRRSSRRAIGALVAAAGTATWLAIDRGAVFGVAEDLYDAALPALVAYALVRHRLFDLDVRFKLTLNRGTVAAVFVAVFFVVAEVAQGFLAESYGYAAGGAAAGLLLFALAPLHRLAERVADAAMPGVADTAEWRAARRADLYRSAVRVAWSDGRLSAEDERHLAGLVDELALPAVQALALRREVEGELGIHA